MATPIDSDQGKLFIGGISWETTEEKLKEYFGRYGRVLEAVVMRDKVTGRPRGFAFVAFADPPTLDAVLADIHTIDGRTVEAKRALSRDEQYTTARSGNSGNGRASGGSVGSNFRTKKIFVGGLPSNLTEEGFRQYFQAFGNIEDVVVMFDGQTNRPRGFGFITFETEESVDMATQKNFHELNGKLVEVKRALPKEANPGNAGGQSLGGSVNYQTYGGSGGNDGSYGGKLDNNRYGQPQSAGAGYPPYGASGYGYGPGNNGGYAGYGAEGYGNAAATGPAGAYGNPIVPTSGYAGAPPGVPRLPWNNQSSTGYGSAGYGAAGSWNTPAGGAGASAPPTGQSPSGAAGYGSQGYGYGGTEGSYGSQGGYGTVPGRGSTGPNNPGSGTGEQGPGSGYIGGAYGNPKGYPTWMSDPSQAGGYVAAQVNGLPGGLAGYGGAFGGAQSR